MAEPASSIATAGAVAATVGVAAWMSSLDPEAVAGAFMGAMVFAITAKDTTLIPKAIYTLVSLIVGYAAVPDMIALTPFRAPLLASFAVSALVMHTTVTIIDRIKTMSVRGVWDALVSVFRKGS
uniref:putative holin n=1 Tax=Castellaniella defragrans TaxID=75697 RepID=UPI003341022E